MNTCRGNVLLTLLVLAWLATSSCELIYELFLPVYTNCSSAHSLALVAGKVMVVGDWHDPPEPEHYLVDGDPCQWIDGIRTGLDFDPGTGVSLASRQMLGAISDGTGTWFWGSSAGDNLFCLDPSYDWQGTAAWYLKDGQFVVLDTAAGVPLRPFLHEGHLTWLRRAASDTAGGVFWQGDSLMVSPDNGLVTGILSQGSHLYLCGFSGDWMGSDPASAGVMLWWWQDGNRQVIDTSNLQSAVASGLVAVGDDFYVYGAVDGKAQSGSSGSSDSRMGEDLHQFRITGQACLWQNGNGLILLGPVDDFNCSSFKAWTMGTTIRVVYSGREQLSPVTLASRQVIRCFDHDTLTGTTSIRTVLDEVMSQGKQLKDCLHDGSATWYLVGGGYSWDVYRETTWQYHLGP